MKTTRSFIQILLIAGLLLASAAPAAPVAAAASGALHPHLAQLAVEQPAARVRVVVQYTPGTTGVASAAERLGGRVVSDLHFMHALAVEIPAGVLPELAQHRGVRAISPDAPVNFSGRVEKSNRGRRPNIFPAAIGAAQLWNEPPYLLGKGARVAVIDSGYTEHKDLRAMSRRNKSYRVSGVNFTDSPVALDLYGHGTQIDGIIAGNGISSRGLYVGVAPSSEIVSIKVCGDRGDCLTSDVLEGVQWVYENGHAAGIRVVNFSINSSVSESYHTNPLCAALELLWLNGFVVIVSAGNQQNGEVLPPANDPFVITVGSVDDQGTPSIADDTLSSFSAYGATPDGHTKPDLVAPGRDLVSLLNDPKSPLSIAHADHIILGIGAGWGDYFRISGTSVSAAVTSGAAALLLEDEPELTPDQVKFRLMSTAATSERWPAYDPLTAGAGYLDIYAAVHADTLESANTQQPISQQLWTEEDWANFGSVNWGTVNWGTVNWGTVNWGTVNWGTVNWGTVNWGTTNFSSDSWSEETGQ